MSVAGTSRLRIRGPLAGAALLLAATAAHATPQEATDPPERVIPLRVLVDEEIRTREGWEAQLIDILEAASRTFEEDFRIRFRWREFEPWSSDDDAPSMEELLDDAGRIGPGDAELVVGLTGQVGRRTAREPIPYASQGKAHYFGPNLVCWVPPSRQRREDFRSATRLVHELGHVFGVWHLGTPADVMHRSGNPEPRRRFSAPAAEAIRIVRDIDFRKGVLGVSEEQFRRLAGVFGPDHLPDQRFPAVDALVWAANRAPDPSTALEILARADRLAELAHGTRSLPRAAVLCAMAELTEGAAAERWWSRAIEYDELPFHDLSPVRREAVGEARRRRGVHLGVSGRWTEAVRELEHVVAMRRRFPSDASEALGTALHHLGWALTGRGDHAAAIERLQEADAVLTAAMGEDSGHRDAVRHELAQARRVAAVGPTVSVVSQPYPIRQPELVASRAPFPPTAHPLSFDLGEASWLTRLQDEFHLAQPSSIRVRGTGRATVSLRRVVDGVAEPARTQTVDFHDRSSLVRIDTALAVTPGGRVRSAVGLQYDDPLDPARTVVDVDTGDDLPYEGSRLISAGHLAPPSREPATHPWGAWIPFRRWVWEGAAGGERHTLVLELRFEPGQ